jgi:hypothetical protein
MIHKGSYHCGRIAFEVEGDISRDCNCSYCSRKGYLHWFVSKQQWKLDTSEASLGTTMFDKHVIEQGVSERGRELSR